MYIERKPLGLFLVYKFIYIESYYSEIYYTILYGRARGASEKSV